jgi:precorrin-6B methylase 2
LPTTQPKTIFILLDTDKHASAFDILTIIDTITDASILKYENVTVQDAENIIHDAMFPRGPEGAKHTKVFINGHDHKTTRQILTRLKETMFPPFQLAIIIDPRGAYTTAAAAVAKTLHLSKLKIREKEEAKVTILAGTGPVGQTAARLYASEKLNVTITSRSPEKAFSLAMELNQEIGAERIRGVAVQTPEQLEQVIRDAEIVLSAGAAATQILPLSVLKSCPPNRRVIADINAIPPLGVEGLEAEDDGKEIVSNNVGVGALTIGKLKNKTEIEIINRAAEAAEGIFDYDNAYEIAKQITAKKQKSKEETSSVFEKSWLP